MIDLARTGPDTPGGRFMRRFWMPVYRAEDLPRGHAKPIRIMSEDFALYRGESGQAQVIDYRCPHRGAQMHLGWVEGDEMRCVYHGWKFDCSGQCIEQPAEEAGFARKVKMGSYPTREHMGLVFAYLGDGAPPPFPPYPAPFGDGQVENSVPQVVPCNYLQCYENSMDEVHVAFAHGIGGPRSGSYNPPEIAAEETPWGMIRSSRRRNGERISLHYTPNCTRTRVAVVANPTSCGTAGWREIYLAVTPIDDENNMWFLSSLAVATAGQVERMLAQRGQHLERLKAAGSPLNPVRAAQAVMDGRVRFAEIDHPDRVSIQDIAILAGQGRIADRSRDRLGRSDTAIILWRKILERELRAIAEGGWPKQWVPGPPDVEPTVAS